MLTNLGRILSGIRFSGLYFFSLFALFFPLFAVLGEFLEHLSRPDTSPWLYLFSVLDAGGQSPSSRALLRSALVAALVFGLLLPYRDEKTSQDRTFLQWPWGSLFLGSGLISVSLSGRLFEAELAWEFYALLLLLGHLLRRQSSESWSKFCGIGFYILALSVYLHSLWIAVPSTVGRLGGVFHHPNALSTFTIMALPYFVWRGLQKNLEGMLAAGVLGTLLALQLWSGSLTGFCLLLAGLAYWSVEKKPIRRRIVFLVVMVIPVICNLLGGWFSAVGIPVSFLSLLLWLLLKREKEVPRPNALCFLIALTVACGSFSILMPDQGRLGAVSLRENSLSARLEFYRGGGELLLESVVFGQGPAAFAREYPSVQESIRYYSKFIHCWPLEILVEWGILGAFLGALFLNKCVITLGSKESELCYRWTLTLFLLHSLSGVQSQFPWLFVLLIVGWSCCSPVEPKESTFAESFRVSSLRLILAVSLIFLGALNLWRLSAVLHRDLASRYFRESSTKSLEPTLVLLERSARLLPTDGQTWYTWAQLSARTGHSAEAAELSRLSVLSDPRWAAPRALQMNNDLRFMTAETVREALLIDPINYPDFYRFEAELLFHQGSYQEALALLLRQSENYAPVMIAGLPDFRAEDLEEQLNQLWLLTAILYETLEQNKEAEKAFRKALYFSHGRLSKLRSLLSYSSRREITLGPLVEDLVLQLSHQVPAKD